MVVVHCLASDFMVHGTGFLIGLTKLIAATSAGSNRYRLQKTVKSHYKIRRDIYFSCKTWFQEHGKDVHDGFVNPNRQAASTLNNTTATWLHTSP